MSKFLWQVTKTAPALLGVSLLFAGGAIAQEAPKSETEATDNSQILEQINQYNDPNSGAMDQVTSVSQLRDVSPGDWAFEALRNLVERYGCIAGYPDRTFRGNQALTRYEFAAGLNACLQQIERLISGTRGGIDPADLEQLRRLVQEFQAELATLGTRVDNLEARTDVLEEQQFSTTTKLKGEAVMTLGSVFGDQKVGGGDLDDNTTFSYRVRLALDTSFTGRDQLITRLQSANFSNLSEATGTDMARLGHDKNTDGSVEVDELYYNFPIGERTKIHVGAVGLDIDEVFDVHNPYFESSSNGALTRFNRRNPIYRSDEGTGLGASYEFGRGLKVSALYMTESDIASNPTDGNGLFNGNFSTGAQVDWELGESFDIGFTYLYGYQTGGEVNLSGSTGSSLAKDPFGLGIEEEGVGTRAHRFGLGGNYRFGKKKNINIGAWGGYINANAREDGAFANKGDSADIWNWAAHVALLDLGGEGNVLGLMGGMPPKLTGSSSGLKNNSTSYLIEAQYRWKVSDNITLTPGAYVVLSPDHTKNTDDTWGVAIRTTFKF